MTKKELAKNYDFSDEELLLNQKGTISAHQQEKIRSHYIEQLNLFKRSTIKDALGFASIIAIANLIATFGYDDIFYNIFMTIVILIPASAVLYSKISTILAQRKLLREFFSTLPNIHKCSRIQKTDFLNLTPHLDDWYESVDIACDAKFEISPSQYEALDNDTLYTFYYINGYDNMPHILSLEVDTAT